MTDAARPEEAIRRLRASMQGQGQEAMRLNRFLAVCGLGSRRGVEALVYQGRVRINGEKVRSPGVSIEPGDHVTVDDRLLSVPRNYSYFAYNKPGGLVVSRKKQGKARTIYEALPESMQNCKYAGRLDAESRGLLILSDDGKFIHALSHPSFRLLKYYRVLLSSIPEKLSMHFGHGMFVDGEFMKASRAFIVDPARKLVEVILSGGKNRQIRRMFTALGVEVLDLYRYRMGQLSLEETAVNEGTFVAITPEDVLESTQPFAEIS
ncbi:MAG: rRNA pseudouridine synthase [Spirochaetales bacterium]|nr:rRNA pseudouridine synthase [Spirochaetales bacterium]